MTGVVVIVISASIILLALLAYGLLALALGSQGRRIVETYTTASPRPRSGDEDLLFAKRTPRRRGAAIVEYNRPMELDLENRHTLAPPPFEVDGRNPNAR